MLRRTLVVAPFARPDGGAETMLRGIVGGLSATDRSNLVVAMFETGPLVDEFRRAGVTVHVLAPWRMRSPLAVSRAARELRRILVRERVEVAVSWLARMHFVLVPAAMSLGRRRPALAWWQHMIPGRHWVDVGATLLPAELVACSSQAGQRAQRALRPGRPTVVCYPGCTRPAGLDRAAARAQLGLPQQATVVCVIGRLQRWKRQEDLLVACAALRARGFDVHAVIVGGDAFGLDEGYGPHLRDLAERLDVPSLFTGQMADPSPAAAAANVVVNTSEQEPFGITLIEAMAAGRAVVAVGSGGPAEVILDGRSGLLTRAPGAGELERVLAGLCEDPDRADRLGVEGRARWEAEFTPARSAQRFAAAVEQARGLRDGLYP